MGKPGMNGLILVVEDSEEQFDLVADMLATQGYEVVGATNGIDAVDTAVKLLPDLIVMDLSLPIMGGCEATRLLKSEERPKGIPVVVRTGNHNSLEMARQAGCAAFLTKPCPPDRLLGEI